MCFARGRHEAISRLYGSLFFFSQNFAKGKISISEMLFGLQLKDAGVKRYPLRNKQRVIQFAVTIFMSEYNSLYVQLY